MKLALSAEFLESFSKLDRKMQARVRKFMSDFQQSPERAGFNFEKIEAAAEGRLRSARISQDYRGILLKPASGDVYVFLWVDKHDDAYQWAERRRISIHPHTGTIQIFRTATADEPEAGEGPASDGRPAASGDAPGSGDRRSASGADLDTGERRPPSDGPAARDSATVESGPRLFDPYRDDELVRVGVPEELLPIVRSLRDEADFERVRRRFPEEASEALDYLAAGIPYSEVLEELGLPSEREAAPVDTEDFAAALENERTRRSVMVVTSDRELHDALDFPLARWRIFLHPQQQRMVNVNASGPYRIHGGAGTGKTVVAMHRARTLVRDFFPDETDRVLFTTFNRNLAEDISRNLGMLCSAGERDRIEVAHIDSWANRFLKRLGYTVVPVDAAKQEELWGAALAHRDDSLALPDEFYRSEWENIIQEQAILSVEEYLTARRAGAGTRLSRKQRLAVWPVFERYRELLSEAERLEYVDILRIARLKLEAGERPMRYAAVVIDEAQDMSAEAFRLARAIVARPGEEIPPNSLFIVGDGHQRIYRRPTTLSACGIPITGRSRRLKLNYRTTEQTRRYAAAVLAGQTVADLDGEADSLAGYTSLLHGRPPIEAPCESMEAEARTIAGQIGEWLGEEAEESELSGVCIVARSRDYLDSLSTLLGEAGITCRFVGRDGDPKKDGVRLATMHRVKGIEYDYIVVAGAGAEHLPKASTVDRPDMTGADRAHALLRERSLLYVALTRARKAVLVTWVGERSPMLG